MNLKLLVPLMRCLDSALFWRCARLPAAVMSRVKAGPKYRVLAGFAAERAGNVRRARRYYERALAAAEAASDTPSTRWLQAARFFYERALSRTGSSEVNDPLFACSICETGAGAGDGAGAAGDSISETGGGPGRGLGIGSDRGPVGFFTLEFVFSGLQIHGFLVSRKAAAVDILLDGVKLRDLQLIPGQLFKRFSFRFTRTALGHFPRSSSISVRSKEGRPLFDISGKSSLQLTIPHGSIASPLLTGDRQVDKKGSLLPTFAELQERRRVFLRLYREARDFFLESFNKQLFLIYGTLLGFVREGGFIPGDDDFDTAFMAEAGDPQAVKRETLQMIAALVEAGFSVSFNRRGRLFRLHSKELGIEGPHLDVHSFWEEDGRIWGHNDFCAEGRREQYVPALERDYSELSAYIPAEAEAFLGAHYGPGWRTPDPAFVNYFSGKNRSVLAHLEKALIGPDEYREYQKRIPSGPGCGEFVSLAQRPLYPLPDNVELLE